MLGCTVKCQQSRAANKIKIRFQSPLIPGMARVAFAVSGDSEGTVFLDELERYYKGALKKVCDIYLFSMHHT